MVDPTIQATNHWAERAIRPAVVNRKVWGGNRKSVGAKAQSTLITVTRTYAQRGHDSFDYLARVLCNPQPQLIPA